MEAISERGELHLDREILVGDAASGYSFVADGDVLIAKVTPCFENGKGAVVAGLTNGVGFATTEVYTLRPGPNMDAQYLDYLLRSSVFRQYGTARLTGAGGLKRVSSTDLRNFSAAVPPLDEQRAIADFLDRETARIDTLIEEQQRLIELLRERRVAIAEGAVAELSWATPLRSVAVLIQTGPFGSQLKSDEYEFGGTPVINPSHMAKGEIAPDEGVAVSADKAEILSRHAMRAGDLVVARRGELGRCAVVRKTNAGALCGTGSALIRLDEKKVDPDFLALVFTSRRNRDSLSLSSVGSTMDNLNADIIGSLRIPAPPLGDQIRIVASVAQATAAVDTLIAETERFIELARERRTALITAAVTGQIDVRGEVA